MSRILVVEADPEVRELLALVVTQLGHEPVTAPPLWPALPPRVDVVVADTALPDARRLVGSVRRRQPSAPVVSLPSGPIARDGVQPLVILRRPFSLDALERALRLAVELGTPTAA